MIITNITKIKVIRGLSLINPNSGLLRPSFLNKNTVEDKLNDLLTI